MVFLPSMSDGVTKGTLSPKIDPSTAAAALLKVLWPEIYSGNGGVLISGVHDASAEVCEFPSRAAS